MKLSENKDLKENPRFLLRLIGVVIGLQILAGVLIFALGRDWATRGQFGDMFGAVNTLFSGLAFSGLIYTIYLQRQEFRLQKREFELNRQELELAREELKGQKEELEKQNQLISDLRLEDTFFRLLQIFRQQFDNILFIETAQGTITSHNAFRMLIQDSIYQTQSPSGINPQSPPISAISGARDGTLKKAVAISMQSTLGQLEPYISSLHTLTQLVVTNRSEQLYAPIISSQLTIDERVVLVMYAQYDSRIREICSRLHLSIPSRIYLPTIPYKENKFLDEVMELEGLPTKY